MSETEATYAADRIGEIRTWLSTGENANPSCAGCNEHVLLAEVDRLAIERDAAQKALADLRQKYDLLALEVDTHDQASSGVGKPWVGPRRPPEYLTLDGSRQVERSATCRCCDQAWRWSWIGEDGLCGACAEHGASIVAARAFVEHHDTGQAGQPGHPKTYGAQDAWTEEWDRRLDALREALGMVGGA